jgi:hypothetical protein
MEGIVHTKELVVPGDQLFQTALRIDEKDEVLDDVQKTGRLTDAAQCRFQ